MLNIDQVWAKRNKLDKKICSVVTVKENIRIIDRTRWWDIILFKEHTFYHPSSSKREVCNEHNISEEAIWLPKFWILGSLKTWKCPLQGILLSKIIPRMLNFALHSRETLLNIHLPNVTIGISIIVYLIPQYFSWLKNYKWQWLLNSYLTLFSLMPKQWKLLLTRIWWWRCRMYDANDEDGG